MKTIIAFLLFIFVFVSIANAQSVLVKGHAFAKKANYGREQKDLEGKIVQRPDSVYFIYLELKGKQPPQISSVQFNGRSFAASVVAVEEEKVNVGKLSASQKQVVLQRGKTTTLWRIELAPAMQGAKASRAKGLILTGKASGKTFAFKAPRWTILAAEEMG